MAGQQKGSLPKTYRALVVVITCFTYCRTIQCITNPRNLVIVCNSELQNHQRAMRRNRVPTSLRYLWAILTWTVI